MTSPSISPRPPFVPRGHVAMFSSPARELRKGRGALSNVGGRHEATARVAEDDGWGALDTIPSLETEITYERPRSIITRNTSPDIPYRTL